MQPAMNTEDATPNAGILAYPAKGGQHVMAKIPAARAWLVPLIEAVCDPAVAASGVKVAGIMTEWGGMPGQETQAEHAVYVGHMIGVIHRQLPWLLPLLDAASAQVAISPGCFCFTVRTRFAEQFDVPELLPFTHLLPWVTDDERKGMN